MLWSVLRHIFVPVVQGREMMRKVLAGGKLWAAMAFYALKTCQFYQTVNHGTV
jgi:hypothetical protein